MMISVIKTIDTLIETAASLGVEIEYISIGPKIMKMFSEELTGFVAEPDEGISFNAVSKYRDISVRLTEVNGLTVKYIVDEQFWGELN